MKGFACWVGLWALTACTVTDAKQDDDASSAPQCTEHADCVNAVEGPLCNPDGDCESLPDGHPIGWGDGSASSVIISPVHSPEKGLEATDLAFHPDRPNELWVLRREYASSEPCTQNNQTFNGCFALEGSIAVIWDAGTETAAVQVYRDLNAWHFMRRPTAFAFGDNGNFASIHEDRSGNFTDDPVDYEGPTLWTSALPGTGSGCESAPSGCFSIQPPGRNGSHLDMLHATPYGMGIAHEQANAYWTFNGDIGALDRYDFRIDHGPGNDDHSDGELRRYVTGQLTRVPNVPSHMEFNKLDGHVYVADTGGGRIVKLDAATGTLGGEATPNYEMIDAKVMDGAVLSVVVAPGVLTAPSGLAIHDGLIYVTDNATSRIHAFDMEGQEVRSLDTAFAPGSLAGFTIGPDGKAYLVEKPVGWVHRIDPI